MNDPRRSPRFLESIPLELSTEAGSVWVSATNIGRHGALLHTPRHLNPRTLVSLRNQKNDAVIQARVVWTAGKDEHGQFRLGIAFAGEAMNFWGEDYRNAHVRMKRSVPERSKIMRIV